MTRARTAWLLAAALAGGSSASAAVKPGFEGAQDLFRRNRWAEARAHVRAQWNAIGEAQRPAASYLIGRSYVREAEFYRAVRRVGADVGSGYLEELAATRANRGVVWLPLFRAFYQLEAGRTAEAAAALQAAGGAPALAADWKRSARLRRAWALAQLGRAQGVAAALADESPEARFVRMLASGNADPSPAPAKTRRERLFLAAVYLRAGAASAAEPLLVGLDLDAADAETGGDPKKVLRFYDPLVALAWERVCWERALAALRPLASATGIEKTLASYYVGLALHRLGAVEEAVRFLDEGSLKAAAPELQPSARLLAAAGGWKGRTPPPAELAALWEATQAQPEAVLAWNEWLRPDLARLEPFASKLTARLAAPAAPPQGPRASAAVAGLWALARLQRGADAGSLLAALGEARDDSNKNKIDSNDPLLLLALTQANYREQEYAQALETLFELSKSFPGLRSLQWNLQGVYAARQKAGGEMRISQ